MIIKKLKLENIRSYKKIIIDLPLGRTLFEGNIGSGKSTILMAIEFALFGLGSEKGGSLLRAGEESGSVSMVFESEGIEYTIRRELKRKKNSIQQTDKCALKSPEGAMDYTPGELKEKILEVLDFNEPPDPKAQSVIYRYAIYTPQEEMKTILSLRPDHRMETLRKAFRTEDYKNAMGHSKSLETEIKAQAKGLTLASDSKEELLKIDENRRLSFAAENDVSLFRKQSIENEQLVLDLKSKREEAMNQQSLLNKSVGRLRGLEELLQNKEAEAQKASQEIEVSRRKISQINTLIQRLENSKDPTEKTLKQLKDEISFKEREARSLVEERARIQLKVQDYGSIVEEGICPTCDRPAESAEFISKIEGKKRELDDAQKASEDCTETVEKLRKLFEDKREYETNQITLGGYIKNLEDLQRNENIWSATLAETAQAAKNARDQLSSVSADFTKLSFVTRQLADIEEQLEDAQSRGKEIAGKLSSARTLVEALNKAIQDLEQVIRKKEELKRKASKLHDCDIWILDYFIPTVGIIEQQVMNKIREDFDAQFQKWFNMLVDDPGKEARIDEEFTPLIQQDGMDQEVAYLSGGEKTSVALAYRLALNSIVSKVAAGAKSNLLILDEPTDGFSKEQLSHVREILDEIKSPQVILVSHETELESFADQVIKITKRDGESFIDSRGL